MIDRRRPGGVVTGIARAWRSVSLYGGDHPVAGRAVEEAFGTIADQLATRPSLRLFIHEDTFYMGRTVLLEESLHWGALLAEFVDRQVGTIEFQPGIEPWELRRLIEVLSLRPAELERHGGAAAALQRREVRHIIVSRTRPMLADELVQFRVDPRDVYRAGLRVVDNLYHQASRDRPLDLKTAAMIVSSLIDVLTEDRAALLGIAALKLYDEETAHHSVNVAALSLLVGLHLQLDRPAMNTLGLAALLHDIGKVRIPHEVLTKQDPPTSDERDQVRRHPLYGAHLLRTLPGPSRLAMVVAFEHHANYNLSGYPEITMKKAPHPLTRIIQMADFFDAATASLRPDRRSMLPSEAMTFVLERAGGAFDPSLARVFAQVLGRYPVGSVVELTNGEVAVVTRPGDRDTSRPVVKIVADRDSQPVTPRTVNLEEAPEVQIVRALDPTDVSVDVTAHL